MVVVPVGLLLDMPIPKPAYLDATMTELDSSYINIKGKARG